MQTFRDQHHSAGSNGGRPLSVAVVTASLSDRAGGLAATIPAGVNSITKLGIEAHIFGLRDANFDAMKLPYDHAAVHAIPAWGFPGMRLAPALDRALAGVDVDVLHLQGLWLYPSIAALRWRARTDRPVMISPHGMLDAWALRNSAWKKRLALAMFERRNLSGAACIHALSDAELNSIRALRLNVPVAVIPNGVDLPPADVQHARPSCLDGDQRNILLFLGRIHPKKGVGETLRAWAQVLKIAPTVRGDWVFVIAGWDDGGHVNGLRRLSNELGLEGSVRFVGPVFGEQKAELLHAASGFVLASHSEGLPVAVLEAWAHECPVFMTPACNLPEGFAAGAAIEIPTEPQAMASILAGSLVDPNLHCLGRAGRALVTEQFSWQRVGCDLAAVYMWLAGHGPKPECVQI